MAKRKIIEIDRDLCNGCAVCTTACAEGALVLDDENKAVLVKEIYCDGLGACLDVCPTDALKVVEKESEGYNARAAYEHVLKTRGEEAAGHVHGVGANETHQAAGRKSAPAQKRAPLMGGCPGSAACDIPDRVEAGEEPGKTISGASELRQWPIQLHLVSPYAPYFQGSDLLIAADCTAFALGSFHPGLLKGKKLVIACPKLDETEAYVEKLAELIKQNDLRSLTVAIMTVPCCSGLYRIVEQAVELSGTKIKIQKRVIHIDGREAA
ncbi:MAG: 4Fe-4S dicluster domain-containing protein [Candidatus Aminicenantes bacterium]|nr:4Fe-4S dicluster domain-containing protein [Candidatus Aminicenantes bacterium]